jgi:DNA-binding transcriptional MerR regulator
MNVTYNEIGLQVHKAEATIKSMAKNNPEQLELLKIGAICKKYGITLDDIKYLIELKERLLKAHSPMQ